MAPVVTEWAAFLGDFFGGFLEIFWKSLEIFVLSYRGGGGGGVSSGDYFAAGNFAEVTEKRVGNFADHLQCNTVYGLVDPKTHDLVCPLPK